MKKDFTYNQSIEFAAELFTKALHEALRKIHKEMNFEINHEEYIILETIFLNPGIIQIDIAKKIITKRSYVCKFLSRLESRGYIRRENAIRGTRQIIMKNYITKEGERVYTKVRNYFIKTFEERENYKEEIELIETTKNTLFELSTKIKKDFNLKF
ncbi:TPA: MarR family transcriptional regulator [Candidatus Galligastranaerophilus intestinavium]|uniref:MarR family transcriptional regulator n=1 Tax=Candidatus Galligastranaerophilus intestinavium TaxID=2840836 RepID=A0A9D1JXI3_9BACT|nr:MarR family transcriptional regulator [Candidatus Galligastranaerophilus intestinavium]